MCINQSSVESFTETPMTSSPKCKNISVNQSDITANYFLNIKSHRKLILETKC